jgi:hypothetical protein
MHSSGSGTNVAYWMSDALKIPAHAFRKIKVSSATLEKGIDFETENFLPANEI